MTRMTGKRAYSPAWLPLIHHKCSWDEQIYNDEDKFRTDGQILNPENKAQVLGMLIIASQVPVRCFVADTVMSLPHLSV